MYSANYEGGEVMGSLVQRVRDLLGRVDGLPRGGRLRRALAAADTELRGAYPDLHEIRQRLENFRAVFGVLGLVSESDDVVRARVRARFLQRAAEDRIERFGAEAIDRGEAR